jgi:hypothetical protein
LRRGKNWKQCGVRIFTEHGWARSASRSASKMLRLVSDTTAPRSSQEDYAASSMKVFARMEQ